MNFWETIQRGEYVMLALGAFILLVVVIWWVKGVTLNRQKKKYSTFIHKLRDYMIEGDIENAKQLCIYSNLPCGRTIGAGVMRLGRPMNEIREAIGDVAEIEKITMARGCRWLRLVSVVAPLLGLGGTLVGIIDRFRDLNESGVNIDVTEVCNAITPAIVTTVVGLGVGIFSLIALTFLEGTINSARKGLDEVNLEFMNLLNEPV